MSEHPASGQHFGSLKERRRAELPLSRWLRPSILRYWRSCPRFVCLPVDLDGGGVRSSRIGRYRAFGLNPRYGNLGRIYFAVHDTLCHYTLNSNLYASGGALLDFDGPCCRLWLSRHRFAGRNGLMIFILSMQLMRTDIMIPTYLLMREAGL